jgi:hypothetical protein
MHQDQKQEPGLSTHDKIVVLRKILSPSDLDLINQIHRKMELDGMPVEEDEHWLLLTIVYRLRHGEGPAASFKHPSGSRKYEVEVLPNGALDIKVLLPTGPPVPVSPSPQKMTDKLLRRAARAQKDPKQGTAPVPPKTEKGEPYGGATPHTLSQLAGKDQDPLDPSGPGQLLVIHDFEAVAKEALQPTPQGRRKLAALMKAVENSKTVIVQEENPGPYMARLQPMLSKGRKFFDHQNLTSTDPEQ